MSNLPRENVQDYPRPPRLEPVPQRILIRLDGVLIAETTQALRVVETHHPPTYYIPPVDVVAPLVRASGSSLCEWKGIATYFDVKGTRRTLTKAAWSYEAPTAPFVALANHIAFYPAQMDECWVGDQRVTPQPGRFYGGWVTPNLDGRIKGAPGTNHW
jgi:uncharacterized protein (DUF427 family)